MAERMKRTEMKDSLNAFPQWIGLSHFNNCFQSGNQRQDEYVTWCPSAMLAGWTRITSCKSRNSINLSSSHQAITHFSCDCACHSASPQIDSMQDEGDDVQTNWQFRMLKDSPLMDELTMGIMKLEWNAWMCKASKNRSNWMAAVIVVLLPPAQPDHRRSHSKEYFSVSRARIKFTTFVKALSSTNIRTPRLRLATPKHKHSAPPLEDDEKCVLCLATTWHV